MDADNNLNTVSVAIDIAEEHGNLGYLCEVGDEVLVYTPTYIWTGKVSQVGPLGFELDKECKIVYETGNPEEQKTRKWKQAEGLGMPYRCTWTGVIALCILAPVPNE